MPAKTFASVERAATPAIMPTMPADARRLAPSARTSPKLHRIDASASIATSATATAPNITAIQTSMFILRRGDPASLGRLSDRADTHAVRFVHAAQHDSTAGHNNNAQQTVLPTIRKRGIAVAFTHAIGPQ